MNRATGDSAPDPTPTEPTPADIEAALTKLNTQLQQLHASLPPRTALVIFSGHSDPRRMAELNARKSAWEMAMKSGKNVEDLPREAYWSSANGRALEEEVAKAKPLPSFTDAVRKPSVRNQVLVRTALHIACSTCD